MLVESFQTSEHPPSLRNAFIILLLKPGKPPTKCEPYGERSCRSKLTDSGKAIRCIWLMGNILSYIQYTVNKYSQILYFDKTE